LASLLTSVSVAYGDWRKVFTSLDEINRVSADDVQRVARKYFIPESRTVALTVQPKRQGGAR
jgi:predicted Zn-dependent peptidase